MIKRLFFLAFLIALAAVLFINPNFKTVAAGVAIFLFGMVFLEDGFKIFSGGMLEKILRKSTDNTFKSIGFGAFITSVMQSSSLVSVLTISFLGAGLIELGQGIGIVFGANIGTTTGAWLMAGFGLKVKIAAYAMPMLVFGIILIFQKAKSLKGIGYILAGLGFLFLGIHYMKDGFEAFKNTIDLTKFEVAGYKGIFLFTGIGIFATVIMQSSHATLMLILAALATGQISYENALALAIGANVGTTITAIIGSLSSNINGKRLAAAHLIFNVITGIIAIVFIYQLMNAVDYISSLLGITSTNHTLKLAVFHTIFNVIGVLVMLPFIGKLEKFLLKVLKEKEDKDIDEPKFLNESVLEFPETAISSLLNESKYLYKNAIFEIVAHALNIHREDIKSDKKIKKIIKKSTEDMQIDVEELYYKKVKTIYGEIIRYATTAQSKLRLSESQNNIITDIKLANRKMVEIIRDVKELRKNVSMYLVSDNQYIKKEYNNFRKKVVKVLRVIYLFRKKEEKDIYYEKLMVLKNEAREAIHRENESIANLIRNDLITVDMASSLVNDNDNVNDLIKKLIAVAELLYVGKDELFENGE